MTDVLPLSPGAFAEWMPFWKAAGFFFATFVLEDVAAVGAGLLLATGQISWPAAFTACFLGIWMGDAGLYALARFAGRKWFEKSSLRRFSAKVGRSEKWFAERGMPILIFSRLIPGARLPTYLAAGFLRVSASRFLLITGCAAFVWTFIILRLTQSFGAQISKWLGQYKTGGFLLLAAGLILFVALQLLRRALMNFDSRRIAARVGRLRYWEFWPAWMFYPPVALNYLWLSIKYRGATLPTAANPGIFSGGMVGESKMATLRELMTTSPEFIAAAELIQRRTGAERGRRVFQPPSFCQEAASGEFSEPFILKPDVGQRGLGIKLIRTREQAEAYLKQTDAALLAQRYAPGPHEVGIFYYRFSHETHGHIFAITEKLFPVIVGDGNSTVSELVWRDSRARFVANKYLKRLNARQDEILAKGETLKLVETGNHAQGCIFRDGMHLNSPALEDRIDEISKKLSGFFIGRYDIRFSSEEDLRAGRNFQIIELNGAASEATSIYDARNSLWSAYRILFRQWDLVFAIGAANRHRGCRSTSLLQLWHAWRNYASLAATYPAAD